METTRSSAPTGFRRLRPCTDESGRNVAPRLILPRQVDSVLDAVDLHTIFAKRAAVMKAIPQFLRGSFRNAMRVAMDEALQTNEVRNTRGWKLFLLLPRMLLHRQDEAATFPEASWCNGLTIFVQVSGPNC